MPLSMAQVKNTLTNTFPEGKIQAVVSYKGLYLAQVFRNDLPFEEDLDPYYSIDQQTGEVKDFSILTDGDTAEIMALFLAAKQNLRKGGL